jgi:hypothetical protein
MFLEYDSRGIKINGGDPFFKEYLNPMHLLLFSTGDDRDQRRLEEAVRRVIPESQIELFKRLGDFGERLRLPVEPDSIVVLSVSNREELQQMQPLRGLLSEIYVVLIVPDRKKSTLELAHLMLPRFLSRKSDSFINLKKVLNKMYRHGPSRFIPDGQGS